MRHLIHCVIFLCVSVVIASSVPQEQQRLSEIGPSKTSMAERALTQKQSLGKKLFFDKNLFYYLPKELNPEGV